MILSLKAQKYGKDYVIGDLHGCYAHLKVFLNYINFNPNYDRVISVGDLIDKGPNSKDCLTLLSEPWFYAVRGNHEDILIKWHLASTVAAKNILEEEWRANGGDWFFKLTLQEQQQAYEDLSALPLMIKIQNKHFQYAIIHAEIPPELDQIESFSQALLNEEQFVLNACLKGRRRSKQRHDTNVNGVDFILCGHTVCTPHFKKIGNSICLDFGAFYQKPHTYLGIFELGSHRLFLANNCTVILHK